jgi:hypothetical protein
MIPVSPATKPRHTTLPYQQLFKSRAGVIWYGFFDANQYFEHALSVN